MIEYGPDSITIPLADLPAVQIGLPAYSDAKQAMPRTMTYGSDEAVDHALREVAAVALWRRAKTAEIKRERDERDAAEEAGLAEAMRAALGPAASRIAPATLAKAARELRADDRLRIYVTPDADRRTA